VRLLYIILIVLLFGIFLGCSSNKSVPYSDCSYNQELGIVKDKIETGAMFLFGETHGTIEAPSFIADFACKVMQDNKEATIVLFELPIPEELSNPSKVAISIPEAQQLIIEEGKAYWPKDHDGRTSVAMMDAIVKILKLREQGLNIYIGGTIPHESNIPDNLNLNLTFADEYTFKNPYFKEAVQILKYKEKFKNVIVLNGSIHIKNQLRFFKKMGVKQEYIGFLQLYGGGTEWNCRYGLGCGSRNVKPSRKGLVDLHENASLVIDIDHLDVFDGAFVFKTINASPPYLKERLEE